MVLSSLALVASAFDSASINPRLCNAENTHQIKNLLFVDLDETKVLKSFKKRDLCTSF